MKQAYLDDCPDYLSGFLLNLKIVRDRADRTEEAYYIDIRTFLRYLKIQHCNVPPDTDYHEIKIADVPVSYLAKFTLLDAYQYLRWLKDTRDNATATRARKASALKQFYHYLHKKAQLIEQNPLVDLELPRVKNKLPKHLSLEQSLELLRNVHSKYPERDYCILTLFLNCGMRLSELVGINLGDFSRENRTLRLFGKGSKERIVYVNDACIEAIDAYLKVRGELLSTTQESTNPVQEALFCSRNRKRISRRRVQEIVENSLSAAGLGNLGVTTHKLRHTAATLMYQHGGVDPLVLKEILGHKSIATTEIYTHLSDENLKKAADSSPLSHVKNMSNNSDSKPETPKK